MIVGDTFRGVVPGARGQIGLEGQVPRVRQGQRTKSEGARGQTEAEGQVPGVRQGLRAKSQGARGQTGSEGQVPGVRQKQRAKYQESDDVRGPLATLVHLPHPWAVVRLLDHLFSIKSFAFLLNRTESEHIREPLILLYRVSVSQHQVPDKVCPAGSTILSHFLQRFIQCCSILLFTRRLASPYTLSPDFFD